MEMPLPLSPIFKCEKEVVPWLVDEVLSNPLKMQFGAGL